MTNTRSLPEETLSVRLSRFDPGKSEASTSCTRGAKLADSLTSAVHAPLSGAVNRRIACVAVVPCTDTPVIAATAGGRQAKNNIRRFIAESLRGRAWSIGVKIPLTLFMD